MANPKKMPAFDRYADTRRRDVRAREIMDRLGCSFSEAWAAVLDAEEKQNGPPSVRTAGR